MRILSRSNSFRIVSIIGTMVFVALGLFLLSSPAEEPAVELTESELSYARETANVVNDFAIDMYLELVKSEGGNVFFAPQNISAALAMAYAGASGENAREMAAAMHFGTDVHRGMGLLERHIEASNHVKPGPQMWSANAVWPVKHTDLKLTDEFESIMKNDYRARIQTLDYARNPKNAGQTINKWVEKRTKNRVKELLSPDDLNQDTLLVLTSATYFLGKWAEPFDKAMTMEEPFYLSNDEDRTITETVPVNLMYKDTCIVYEESKEAQMISMPYEGDQYAMVFVLPQPGISLVEYEKTLCSGRNREQLQRMIDARSEKESVNVYIPKFRMEKKYKLRPLLENLGMRKAFIEPGFPKMLVSSSTGEPAPILIHSVIHQTFIELDEEKTEAAAATAVNMDFAAPPPTLKPNFRADRPFIYLLVDKRAGCILFMGRFVKPE